MTRDDDLRVRIGRIRNTGSARRAKPFIAQALAAAEKAGGLHRRSGRGARSGAFGRGRAATLADHAQGNPRALMNIAGELLAAVAQRDARRHPPAMVRD